MTKRRTTRSKTSTAKKPTAVKKTAATSAKKELLEATELDMTINNESVKEQSKEVSVVKKATTKQRSIFKLQRKGRVDAHILIGKTDQHVEANQLIEVKGLLYTVKDVTEDAIYC